MTTLSVPSCSSTFGSRLRRADVVDDGVRASQRWAPFVAPAAHPGPIRRALFYSHDTLGLGHLRRTLLLSEGLTRRFGELSTLIVTGSPMAHAFRVGPGVDYVKLPSVHKVANEIYEARTLPLSHDEVFRMRRHMILDVTRTYRPDVIFVDNVPLGAKGEMIDTLRYVRRSLPSTRVFLSLRDVIDTPDHVIPLWRRLGVFDALERFYDRIVVYGSPNVFDLASEYRIPPAIRRKMRFCGYINRRCPTGRSRELRRQLGVGDARLILVTVGGGSDGASVVSNFLRAMRLAARSEDLQSVVLLGPEMPPSVARQLAMEGEGSSVRFIDFTPEPLAYLDAADLVVSMGGYNTVSEILSLQKRAIVIPRTKPREEQLIRCQRLAALGLLRMIHPAELSPERLAGDMLEALSGPTPDARGVLDFNAIERLSREIEQAWPGPASSEAAT